MTRVQYRKQKLALAFDPAHLAKLNALAGEAAATLLNLEGVVPAIASGVPWDGRQQSHGHE